MKASGMEKKNWGRKMRAYLFFLIKFVPVKKVLYNFKK